MGTRIVAVAIVTLLVVGCTIGGAAAKDHSSEENNGSVIGAVIGATVGAGLALVGLPVCLGALGFTGAGIAAGSIAAKMMSAAAIANGGGVAAGSTVAVLQSIGAAGLSAGAKVGLTAALGSAGAASSDWITE
ncbi:interferon alpha-inducible protein 27-like protein 2A isoform X1 [Serinus canaria]|nr:interferon alpha-inducible protein 27-like protein 2A isoform X1 [Serinus canaria]XP_018778120.1 interferon alpha-inducible protein 27-like protein 2A isoform X1 [Serinus canaria]